MVDYSTSNQTCIVFPQTIQNCVLYNLNGSCLQCGTYQQLVQDNLCLTCNGTGRIVVGGCTTDPGCIEATPLTFFIYPTLCLACNGPEYYLDASNICRCGLGTFSVTGLCTAEIGCVTTKRVNGAVQCVTCNSSLNLVLNAGKCECIPGFIMLAGKCKLVGSECGDGEVIG